MHEGFCFAGMFHQRQALATPPTVAASASLGLSAEWNMYPLGRCTSRRALVVPATFAACNAQMLQLQARFTQHASWVWVPAKLEVLQTFS